MVVIGDNWKCPYCGHAQVLNEERVDEHWHRQEVEGWKEDGQPMLGVVSVVCANSDCRELSLKVHLGHEILDAHQQPVTIPGKSWTLLPPSSAKPQPNCIPQPIRDDYYEACSIRDLSPKASATIIRRCLQGMIRDFCGISKKRLIDEINELRERVHNGNAPPGVQPDNVEAIDIVRKIGNIGAHMEADINVIVEVDPDEAQTLIDLTETLFSDWYVAREARAQQMSKLKSIADQKALKPKFGSAKPPV
jgi:hypothetical protein